MQTKGKNSIAFPAKEMGIFLRIPELLYFLCFQSKQIVQQVIELPMSWDAITSIWRHCNEMFYLSFQVSARDALNAGQAGFVAC